MIACHCKKCGASDPAGFYGYQPGECKNCTRARVRANRDANVDYYRAFDRARGKTPERKKMYLALWKTADAPRKNWQP